MFRQAFVAMLLLGWALSAHADWNRTWGGAFTGGVAAASELRSLSRDAYEDQESVKTDPIWIDLALMLRLRMAPGLNLMVGPGVLINGVVIEDEYGDEDARLVHVFKRKARLEYRFASMRRAPYLAVEGFSSSPNTRSKRYDISGDGLGYAAILGYAFNSLVGAEIGVSHIPVEVESENHPHLDGEYDLGGFFARVRLTF